MRLSRPLFILSLSALVPACATHDAQDPPGAQPPDPVEEAVCPPPALFQHAVCACDDLADLGVLRVRSGPSGVGSVGVDGRSSLASYAEVSGTWYAWGGFRAAGAAFGDSLVTPADVYLAGDVRIHGDVTIGGDLTCTGRLDIDGTLALAGAKHVLGLEAIGQRGPYTAPAAPPCACDPATMFDVEAAVAAAKQATNGQSSWSHLGVSELHLTTGNYYVTAADVLGHTTIFVDGAVSVFVDGSLDSVGIERWKLATGASLDLFVSGDVISVGVSTAGDPNAPSAFRLYVGGAGKIGLGSLGHTEFYGSLYAPRAVVTYAGDAHIVGAIFAKTLIGSGLVTIDYGAPDEQPTSCTPPPGGDGPVFL